MIYVIKLGDRFCPINLCFIRNSPCQTRKTTNTILHMLISICVSQKETLRTTNTIFCLNNLDTFIMYLNLRFIRNLPVENRNSMNKTNESNSGTLSCTMARSANGVQTETSKNDFCALFFSYYYSIYSNLFFYSTLSIS